MLKKGISVAILAYKEEENLKILIPDIIAILTSIKEEYEIIIIDTEKPLDHTADVCEKYGCRYVNQYYPAFGGAFRVAIECAEYDKFLILDADGSHPPVHIPEMYEKFVNDHCDVVIGSRYVKGGKTEDSKSSVMMSKILNGVFRIALGINAHDISTDYRLYQTEQLKEIELTCENYDVLQEVLLKMKMKKKSLKIEEVPIVFKKRVFGESKRKLIPFIISYIDTLLKLSALRFPLIANFIIYILFGFVGAIVELSIFWIMSNNSLAIEIASLIAGLCGFAITFSLNTFLNFRKTDKLMKRFLCYGLFCLIGIAFSTIMISLLKKEFNIFALKGALLLVVSLIQFFLNKYITFRG